MALGDTRELCQRRTPVQPLNRDAHSGARPPHRPPLPLRRPTPHAHKLRIIEGEAEALGPHRTARTDGLSRRRVPRLAPEERCDTLAPASSSSLPRRPPEQR